MTTKFKLTKLEQQILDEAARRTSRIVLPLPDDLEVDDRKVIRALNRLIKSELIVERPVRGRQQSWRTDDDGRKLTLQLSEAGVAEIGPSDASIEQEATETRPGTAARITEIETNSLSSAASAPRGKLGQVIQALSQQDGATINELIELTNWQAHTIRASLTRLRQRGMPVRLEKLGDRKAYVATEQREQVSGH